MRTLLLVHLMLFLSPFLCKADRWNRKADFPGSGRRSAYGFSIGNKGYIGGGDANGPDFKDFWEYDVSNDKWTQKSNPPFAPPTFRVGFSIGSHGYVFAGLRNELWEYTPSSDTWVKKASLPGTNKPYPVFFVIGNKVYLGGGNTGNSFYCYDPSKDLWTRISDIPEAFDEAVGFSSYDKGYVTSMLNSVSLPCCSAALIEYDPATNVWIKKTDFPGTQRTEGCAFTIGNIPYYGFGDPGTGGIFKDWWQYDVSSNSWVSKTPIPSADAKDENPSFVINYRGYVCFGTDFIMNKEVWEYIPDSVTGITICEGSTARLSTDGVTSSWNSSDPSIVTIQDKGTVKAISSGTVRVVNNDSSFIETFLITVLPVPSIGKNITNVSCFGENSGSINTSISGGIGPYIYAWSNGDSSVNANNLTAGAYQIYVKDSTTGCIVNDSFIVIQPDSISVEAEIRHDNCQLGVGEISLKTAGGTTPYSYLWFNTTTSSSISGLRQAIYSVSITDANNCKEDMTYSIADSCSQVVIHNGISPNGDGINDVWVVEKIQNYSENVVQIFDKKGDVVYQQRGYNNDWNGTTSHGTKLPDGSYFYIVKLNSTQTPDGKNVFTGTLLIKR